MKKLLSVLLVLCVLALPVCAFAEIDLSGLSFAELIDLRQQIDRLLFGSDEYKEVTVPQGNYTVGVDIPAGAYSLSVSSFATCTIYEDSSADFDKLVGMYALSADSPVAKLERTDGQYVELSGGSVVFKTYTGLGF